MDDSHESKGKQGKTCIVSGFFTKSKKIQMHSDFIGSNFQDNWTLSCSERFAKVHDPELKF